MYLAIDTFSEIFEICIFSQNQILTRQMYFKKRQFSDFLPFKLKQIKDELNIDYSSLTGVIVNKGPGSYTGVRVGVSVAKSVAYSFNIPVYAFLSVDAIAYKYRVYQGYITVILNAGKKEAYFRQYLSDGSNIEPVSNLKLVKQKDIYTDISGLVVLKNLQIENLVSNEVVFLNESVAYEGGLFALKHNLIEDMYKLEPVYLRGL